LDEKALIEAARDGDRTAYGELYKRFARLVHGVLLARVSADVASDLLQDVFLKAMLAIRNLRDGEHFGAWLCAIARNRARDFYREHREEQPKEGFAEEIAQPEHVTTNLDARHILSVLQTLPEAYRESLALRLVEGLTGPEIAERTGLSHGSVRVNLHRGMQMLREALQAGTRSSGGKRFGEQGQGND
jgi:RNA polymerase sigma-70 factor (ECF subfamily)